MNEPLVTIVIPAYREAKRLPALLDGLVDEALRSPGPPTEILVVDDGSGPEHVAAEQAAVERATSRCSAAVPLRLRFLPMPRNSGKGAAVRTGWSNADGGANWLGFLDADGAVSARETWRLIRMLEGLDSVDLLAATRIRMAGRAIERSLVRHLQGRVFATLTEQAFRLGFYDTQCGFKLIRGSMLRPILPRLEEDRWLLDIELLTLLHRVGARFREEPIDWRDPGGSKVIPGLDAVRMALGLWRMRRRLGPG